MAKPVPRIGSRRNGRIGLRKSARRIPKGVIHVQASFNNTIVTVTDVRGRVISWSSAGTCGFKGTRRGTPFAAQTAAGNAIRTVVDQGMQRAEVMIKGPGLGRDAALRAIRRSGNVAPIPNQRAAAVPIKKTVVATGRRNGFWNLLTFSKKGPEMPCLRIIGKCININTAVSRGFTGYALYTAFGQPSQQLRDPFEEHGD
ncbi:hypothetical protein FH972_026749 [Carpinus fangiana]|uniref:30S ribosomal protein S11, chloroplastic n=5 Tax=Mesangiospermae TaxID=1437183 RepID=A0A5N6L4W8_9ROSI|nr:hypothetical protein FH972_026749 [Carpinus fangiana]